MTPEHHLSHATHAYNSSKFDGTALVFVIDRDGSQIWDPEDGKIEVCRDGEGAVKHIGRECESVYLFKEPVRFRTLHKAFWMENATFVRSPKHISKGYSSLVQHLRGKYTCEDIKIKSGYGITKVYESATTLIGEGPLEMVGHVTSSYYSPNLNKSIALAVVKNGKKLKGKKLYVPMKDKTIEVTVSDTVFFDKEGSRLNA